MTDPYVLDANAVAGELWELFGEEMTATQHQCANCGYRGAIGSLRAWIGGPGVVLRCVVCSEVVLRWSRTASGVRIDQRGIPSARLPKR